MADWIEHFEREIGRFFDGETRLPGPDEPDARQKQLTRMGNAAWAAGLAVLMLGRREEAREWLIRAAETYRELAGSATRKLGSADRRDEVTADRR